MSFYLRDDGDGDDDPCCDSSDVLFVDEHVCRQSVSLDDVDADGDAMCPN